MIFHKTNLKQLCGDIGNIFPNSDTNEKVYIPKVRIDFCERLGTCVIIKKMLYGICSGSRLSHAHLVDIFGSFGFT